MNVRGKYYLRGNKLLAGPDRAEQVIARTANVYEVVRIINGLPLFCEEHCTRLAKSAGHLGLQYVIAPDEMFCRIRRLVSADGILYGNIRITLTVPGNDENLYLFFIPYHYPGQQDYLRGVELRSMQASRPDPNAKIANLALREKADAMIKREGVFEVLLVDDNGFVTEGSRSNIFFVDDNQQIVTPELRQVLPGITRQKVIEICKAHHIAVRESKIEYDGIGSYRGAFITGTSPKVLPVAKIDRAAFAVDLPVIGKLMGEYDKRVEDYLKGLKYICEENR